MRRLDLKNLVKPYYNLDTEDKELMIERIKKTLKRKKIPLLLNMQEIVNKHLKHYQSDFYIHDVELINVYENNDFIWIVRNSGTHYINLESIDFTKDGEWTSLNYFNSIMSCEKVKAIYFIKRNEQTMKKVNKQKALNLIKKYESRITSVA